MKKIILTSLLLAGCATSSGIIPDGKESYIVIVSGAHRFTSASDLKIDAYQEAHKFCSQQTKQIETIAERSIQAGVITNSSEAELKFRCIPKS